MVPGREARCTVERRVGVGLSQGSSGRVGRRGGQRTCGEWDYTAVELRRLPPPRG